MRAPPELAIGTAERAVVVVERLAGILRMALLGPVPPAVALDPAFRVVAERALRHGLRSLVPIDDCGDDMERTAALLEEAIRAELQSPGADACATLLVASVVGDELRVAHTGHGTALLVRDDRMTAIGQLSEGAHRLHRPWISARPDETGRSRLHEAQPTRLRRGDRVLLTTSPLSALSDRVPLEDLLLGGSADVVALSLEDILEVQSGTRDVGVAVVDWRATDRDTHAAARSEALLNGLSGLIDELTEELQVEPPTPCAAPRRVADALGGREDDVTDRYAIDPTDESEGLVALAHPTDLPPARRAVTPPRPRAWPLRHRAGPMCVVATAGALGIALLGALAL